MGLRLPLRIIIASLLGRCCRVVQGEGRRYIGCLGSCSICHGVAFSRIVQWAHMYGEVALSWSLTSATCLADRLGKA